MPYQLREKSTLYAGRIFTLEMQQFEDDLNGKPLRREVVVHPGAVVILPFASGGEHPTRNDTILLIRNVRLGIGKQLVELPAGTLEKNEAPINCAGRELQEETGYLARKLVPMGGFYSSPGIMTERLYAYAAFDLTQTQTHFDDGEQIELLPTKFIAALDMIKTGEIEDGKTIATLLMYALMFKH